VSESGGGVLRGVRDFLARHLAGHEAESAVAEPERLNLAVAALLVEIVRADHEIGGEERRQALESIARLTGLRPEARDELLANAELEFERSHDLYQFTSQVNRAYAYEDKLRLVEQLWRIARADEVVHKYEEHLIRRIADLLHVAHPDFIAAKLRSEVSG
jgi:uncharacterized tellurite resistance protein B-like protein